jgi:predicted O-linked N-acetylglucosamine transferase (SPINDLY family)
VELRHRARHPRQQRELRELGEFWGSADLQPHAVARLVVSVREHSKNQSIVQVSAFVFGERVDDAKHELWRRFADLMVLPQTTIESKLPILMAIAKLAGG